LLPANLVFPRAGQIWETLRMCEVYGRPCRNTPLGVKVKLRPAERVRILPLDDPKPLSIVFETVVTLEEHRITVPHVPVLPPDHTPPFLFPKGWKPSTLPQDCSRCELSMRTAPTFPFSRDGSAYFNDTFRLVQDVA